jgi:hypothetical protein
VREGLCLSEWVGPGRQATKQASVVARVWRVEKVEDARKPTHSPTSIPTVVVWVWLQAWRVGLGGSSGSGGSSSKKGGGGLLGSSKSKSKSKSKKQQVPSPPAAAGAAAALAWEDGRPSPHASQPPRGQGREAVAAAAVAAAGEDVEEDEEEGNEKGALDTAEAAQRRKVRVRVCVGRSIDRIMIRVVLPPPSRHQQGSLHPN